MTNRIISIIGILLWFSLMPFILYSLSCDFFAVLFLTRDNLYISFLFGLIPFLLFSTCFVFTAVLSILFGKTEQLKTFIKTYFNNRIVLLVIIMTAIFGLISKPLLKYHLINNGYSYYQTKHVKKSFDKDFFIINE